MKKLTLILTLLYALNANAQDTTQVKQDVNLIKYKGKMLTEKQIRRRVAWERISFGLWMLGAAYMIIRIK